MSTEIIPNNGKITNNGNIGGILKHSGVPYTFLAQGKTQGSTLQQRTNKTLTIGPFGNTYKEDEVSPEVEAGVVA
jgi:hypothetical protein